MLGIEALLLFVALVLGGYGLATRLGHRREARQALDDRLATMTGLPPAPPRPSLLRDQRLSSIRLLNALFGRVGGVRRFERLVRQAGSRKRVGEVLLYIPLLAGTGGLLTTLLGGRPVVAVGAAALGGAIPYVVLGRMRRKRALRFGEQLPEALDLIRAALQAGHGFVSALNVVADEFPDPIAQEFRDVAEEMRLGLPLRDALNRLAGRVDDPNLPILSTGVLIAHEIGGNLAEVLDNVAHTIRERARLLREVHVLTAQGRFSGRVLTCLPFFVAGCMLLFNRSYFNPMLESSTGHYLLGYALTSILCGHLVIQRLVRMRV